MDQSRRRHLAISDMTCPHCADKQDELDRKTEILRKLSEDNTTLAERVSGHAAALEAAGQKIRNLEMSITRRARESARSEQVEAVISHWKTHRPKTRASAFPPGGKNWQLIEKALGLMAEDEDGPVAACREAIDGLHMAPFEAYGKRFRTDGKNRTLRNRLEHALGDETRIERCRDIARWVRGDGADRAYRAWEVARWTEAAMYEVLVEEIDVRRRPVEEPRFEVDGIPVTESGR